MTTLHLITFLLSIVGAMAVLMVIYERRKRRNLQAALRRMLQRRSDRDSNSDS